MKPEQLSDAFIGNIPEEFIPSNNILFCCDSSSGSRSFIEIQLNSSGQLGYKRLHAGTYGLGCASYIAKRLYI